jgi:hypothetical protein
VAMRVTGVIAVIVVVGGHARSSPTARPYTIACATA